jgi:hypothetical protein
MVRKKLRNYTSGGVGDGGRDLPSCPTALGGARYCSTFPPLWGTTVGAQSIFNNLYFFCLNSDGNKLYMKIVTFDEIYNFVVQSFSI